MGKGADSRFHFRLAWNASLGDFSLRVGSAQLKHRGRAEALRQDWYSRHARRMERDVDSGNAHDDDTGELSM